ncbi:hypothetical protein [Hymenobacter actinosclerus]|uniref:Uncharacterized protein n=1 Tax=Hymenobacter actinosclerus TaxID=82805 RepID=A0A1I0IMW5_9BACT|nr:hypothetical protein [Hymenobacter actinosclerus]SET98436.1 hypothetical protein SAMN04487998_3395 [Hymenobacter actinosclerus]
MIVDLPTSKDFENIAREWFLHAFDILYDYGIEERDISHLGLSQYKFNKTKLSSIIVLVHQSFEATLKATVCNLTPLLLLDLKPSDWPTLPGVKDKSFDGLMTIGAEALIKVFCAVNTDVEATKNLVPLFQEVRTIRNQIVHSLYKEELNTFYLLDLLFRVSEQLFHTDLFALLRTRDGDFPNEEFFANNPHLEDDSQGTNLEIRYRLQSWAEEVLGNKKLQSYLKNKGRAYNCCFCWSTIDRYETKTAYLRPNSSVSKTIYCSNCLDCYPVMRASCLDKNCKGNVLYEEGKGKLVCLTCGTEGSAPDSL